MSDLNQTSKKLQHHVAYLCRLSAIFLLIIFVVGCTFTTLGKSADNFLNWRMNLAIQLFERSHLPLISFALYAMGITGKAHYKHHASVYWKRLTILSTLCILLYLGALANSSHRVYSLIELSYQPTVSYEENLKSITSKINQISSLEEAEKSLENATKRAGQSNQTRKNANLESIKNNILETEKTILRDLYNKQKEQFENNLRNKRFESIRYAIYSCIFIAFYSMLMLFFNRLHKSS
jgi:hypothetical protein